MAVIQLRNLSKCFKVLNRREGMIGALKDLVSQDYRFVKAVDGITMDIAKNEIVGFLGPNGAGKSTTIKMMTGVLEPTAGEIRVNGNVPYRNRIKNANNIGVVFGQRSQLWWELPVIESFKILKEIYRMDPKSYDTNMGIFNELVDLKRLYSTPVRYLSLGQRMLCDIVAAFLHNPQVIFLDEPTIGLDVVIKNKIRNLIKDLNHRRGATILLTTHDISDIEALCKRIVIIDRGHIIYDGDTGRVNRLFGAYRTLKVIFNQNPDELQFLDTLQEKLAARFVCEHAIQVEQEAEWVNFTIYQDEVKLMEIINYLDNEFSIKDFKIEEIKMENVIRKIYEGALK
ncbi:MAG TPA: ATP-binding cassette domain-containing protein [Bacillota bacterium]|nr:ATP-binding cassette domain-containing protein [Bacillota bacterium]